MPGLTPGIFVCEAIAKDRIAFRLIKKTKEDSTWHVLHW
jgi:hypothetical protein